ncbi:MAG TPA: hypothetical protein VHZ03_00435 [Trebonia sp.]|jgi:acyl-CoA synthetase (AMP-forming)/AMP-acid ligase II|nr:hypothetical protein [Trebonia sp.]
MFPALPSSRDVEVALRRHPCVWDAATVEVTDRHGHLVMAAVVQLAAPLPDAAAELAEYCRVRLPASQVPAQWVVSGPDGATSPATSPQSPDCRRTALDIPQQAHRAPHLDA